MGLLHGPKIKFKRALHRRKNHFPFFFNVMYLFIFSYYIPLERGDFRLKGHVNDIYCNSVQLKDCWFELKYCKSHKSAHIKLDKYANIHCNENRFKVRPLIFCPGRKTVLSSPLCTCFCTKWMLLVNRLLGGLKTVDQFHAIALALRIPE